jgi:hypothetical protein
MEKIMDKKIKDKMVRAGGIVTDREIPIALLGIVGIANYDIRKVQGAIMNSTTLDFLNMVTHVASQRWHLEIADEFNGEEITADTLDYMLREIPNLFDVVMSEYEIKKFLEKRFKRKYGNSAQIYDYMKNIGTISIDGILPVEYKEDGKKAWVMADVTGGFAEVHCTTEKGLPSAFKKYRQLIEKGIHKEKERCIYIVRFIGTWGMNYILNILNNRVRILPERFFEHLSANARLLARVIIARRNRRGTITLQQMRKLFGWKGDWGDVLEQISKIEKIWRELEDEKVFLIVWQHKKGKKENTEWTYERRDRWFYLPKKVKKSEGAE